VRGPRRAIVEVRWAKVPVRRAVIEPGGTLRVGRTERADLAVPADRSMSAVHCELRWDGERCRVVDLSSQGGTFLNGERVDETEVANGAWIRAGGTVLSVYLEGATPPRAESGLKGDGTDQLTPTQQDALAALRAEPAPLFAVLDAARTLRVIEVLRESVEEHRSLYEGVKGEALAMQAPYLVRLPAESRLLEQLVLEGWSRRWGIYLTCQRPFDEVRTQLRRSLMVTNDQTGERMYFRFYDPRMLRLFLPTCGVRQKEQLFGEIEAFLVAGRDGEVVRLTAREAPAFLTSARVPEPEGMELDG
jgi:pSer/pThr/pTyr-binding forkhead associated (FHA) protein